MTVEYCEEWGLYDVGITVSHCYGGSSLNRQQYKDQPLYEVNMRFKSGGVTHELSAPAKELEDVSKTLADIIFKALQVPARRMTAYSHKDE